MPVRCEGPPDELGGLTMFLEEGVVGRPTGDRV